SGKISEIWKSGDFVEIGLNGPRISAGASGFISNVSSWLGAPRLKIMMAERSSRPITRPAAFAPKKSASEKPIAPSAPTFRKSRRVVPLQVVAHPWPRISNMGKRLPIDNECLPQDEARAGLVGPSA